MVDGEALGITKDTFSLDDFISGVSYPEDEVKVYFDAQTANKALAVRDKIRRAEAEYAASHTIAKDAQRTLAGDGDAEKVTEYKAALDALNAELDALYEKLDKSAVIFELRGMPPYIVQNISAKHMPDRTKKYEEGAPEELSRDNELIAKSIIGARTNDGKRIDTVVDVNYVAKLRDVLLDGEVTKILIKVAHVNMNGSIFEQAVDAGFLGGRAKLA